MITAVRPKMRNQRVKPSTITLTDFMRIQNEIIPSNAEYENRKEKDRTLKQLSQTKASNWPDSIEMKKKNQFESHKNKFLEQEMIKRKIDEEEQKFQDIQNNLVIERARKLLFEQQDPVKSFNSKLMYSDMLKEREFQKDIVERKKRITIIFHKFHRKKNTNMKTLELLPSQGSNGCYILHLAWTGSQKVLREGAGCRYVILSTKSTWLYLLSFLLVL